MSIFHPTMLRQRIFDIGIDELKEMGVKALLLDKDNTLTKHHDQQFDDRTSAWLTAVREAGIAMMIVSNSREPRIRPFGERMGLPFVHTACKPLPFGFRRAVKVLGVDKTECLAIGDQTFTDVLGARLCGIRVCQLMPIEVEKKGFRLRRHFEKGILRRYQQKQEKRGKR